MSTGFQRLAAFWATPGVGRVALCSPLVGVIAGLGAVGFLLALQAMYTHVLGGLLHFHMPPTLEGEKHAITYPFPWWMIVLAPTVGGLISGFLVFTWAPEAEGHGTDAMIRAFHKGGGMIRTRVPFKGDQLSAASGASRSPPPSPSRRSCSASRGRARACSR